MPIQRPTPSEIEAQKWARFHALPAPEKTARAEKAGEILDRIHRLDRWFMGLPLILAVVIVAQFVTTGRVFAVLFLTGFVMLALLTAFVVYRARLLVSAGRYLDPDRPID